MEPIEKNQLVTEYVGEAITQEEAEERGKVYDSCGQTYLFDLDFNEGECLYTLDAKKYGNISHFINHSVSDLVIFFLSIMINYFTGKKAMFYHFQRQGTTDQCLFIPWMDINLGYGLSNI